MNWLIDNKTLAFFGVGLFVLTGTYNAVVINSESRISSEVKFVKRLDEVYGVTIAGREVAATVSWQKLSKPVVEVKKEIIVSNTPQQSQTPEEPTSNDIPQAAVQEQLSLTLTEVINTTKWKDGLKTDQFYGSLFTSNGVIEDLNVTLPNGEGLAVSFSEMTGNVFEYDFNGELFSGMMYQVDQAAYMVTLTNGPLEGTRLRFSSSAPAEEQYQDQQYLAENEVEAGSFGNNSEEIQAQEIYPETMMHEDLKMQQEAMQAQGYNLDQGQGL